jgi:S1-C subfamily serine protease
MSVLQDFSRQLSELAAAAAPSVVSLRRTRTPVSATVWSGDRVVTAAHALGPRDRGTVRIDGGGEAGAEVVGRDPSTDLALLRIDAELTAVRRSEALPAVGSLVLSVGRRGGDPSVALGVVGTVGAGWRTRGGGRVDAFVDVDGVLPLGFSGGPLLALDGTVVGINTHGLTRGGTTLPVATVSRVVAELERHGTVHRGFLGVGVHPVALAPKTAELAGRARALLVLSVADGGPAERGGIVQGDAIVAIDGAPTESTADLFAALWGRADQEAVLDLVRGGAPTRATVRLGRVD